MSITTRPPVTIDDPLDQDLPCDACGYNLRTRRPSQDCPECGAGVRTSIEEWERKRLAGPLTLEGFRKPIRSIYVLLGVLLPIAPFVLVELLQGPILVDWQSGEWQDYIGMLLGGVPSRPFYPFMLFACVAMLALVARPIVLGRRRWVRFGLIVGIVIGVQYTMILCASMGGVGVVIGLIAVGVSLKLGLLFWKFPRHRIEWFEWSWITPWHVWMPIGSLALLGLIISGLFGVLDDVFALVLVLGLVGSPWLCLTVYTLAYARVLRSARLLDDEDNTDARWLWCFGGVTGYLAAWGGSVALAMEAYVKLPTQPCYVCTAAANGHASLVGSEPVTLTSGETIRVNRQMRILKAAELALLATTPKGHRACRAIYDRVGPILARRITSPVVADMVYLSLVPIAWGFEMVLRRVVPGFNLKADRLYRAASKG